MKRYLTAKEAADLLGVQEATLYAYVSRGLIRSETTGEGRRERRYLAEDVHKLLERKALRRDQNPAKIAQGALQWGMPVMDSEITLITEDALYYRGQDVCRLAVDNTFEQVAALLWTGETGAESRLFAELPNISGLIKTVAGLKLPFIQAMAVAAALASTDDLSAYDLRPEAVARTGARIIDLFTGVATNIVPSGIAHTLAIMWKVADWRLLNAALILCADHELNASSFVGRVVASAEANPYAVVGAGLAALQGFKHGGHTARVTALLREVSERRHARSIIAGRLRRGEGLPGFGHRLYPRGDPRAALLLSLLAKPASEAQPEALVMAQAVIREAAEALGQAPSVDFALATMEFALRLPEGAALAIFALGRTAGWIGHAIEQYSAGTLIRPRARYRGKAPEG